MGIADTSTGIRHLLPAKPWTREQEIAERNEAQARAQLEGGPACDPTQSELSRARGSFLYGRPYEYWAGLAGVLDSYGADADEVERLLQADRERQRTERVVELLTKGLEGRALGSLTSPRDVAKVLAKHRDKVIEALR